MRNSSDPSTHRQREQRLIEHVERLLNDDRLRIDTTNGRRAVATLRRDVRKEDREVDLKRMMGEMGIPDRQLQAKMPLGQQISVTLSRTAFLIFKKVVGELKVVCLSPRRELLEGKSPQPLSAHDVKQAMTELVGDASRAPATIVLMSTCGFDLQARELVDRRADRTLILVEPNDAGGWSVTGPAQVKGLADLFDPEVDTDKRKRIREAIEVQRGQNIDGTVAANRVATTTNLPLGMVEDELKSYAGETPGLVAKRIEGTVVLFNPGGISSTSAGGSHMTFWDNIKGIFSRRETPDRKIARLSETRVGLSQQREKVYELIGNLEKKEVELTSGFAQASALAQRRIATEVASIRADMQRRHQLLSAIDKKINVVNAAMHRLEMEQQVNPGSLQPLEALSQPSEQLEEGMAMLDQMDEDAEIDAEAGMSALSDNAQGVFEELKARTTPPAIPMTGSEAKSSATSPTRKTQAANDASLNQPRRADAEPG